MASFEDIISQDSNSYLKNKKDFDYEENIVGDKEVKKDQPKEKRPEHVFESGAKYTGEWVGSFREGQGT